MMKIIIFLCDKNYKEGNVSITFKDFLDCKFTRDGLIDLFTDYYGCDVTALSLVEGYNFSEFCLPITYQVLDEMCQKEFNQYVPSANLYPEPFQSWVERLPDNAKVFAYQTNPQKIISYEKAKRLFIDFILPQQFLFHVNGWRINFPDYLSKVELPFAGRRLSKISSKKK